MSRILVIDDGEAFTRLLCDFLISHGYEAESAANAEQAFQAVKRQKPDLLLLDIQLPDINGFELCKHFRSRPDTRSIPIIMVSATAIQPPDKVQGLQFGADDYLSKPFDLPELLERIRAVMRRNRKAPASLIEPGKVPSAGGTVQRDESGALSVPFPLEAIVTALCAPSHLPAETTRVSLQYLIAMALLLAGGLATGSGVSFKPMMVFLLALTMWVFLVSVYVVSCSVLGIELNWRSGANLFSLAALPLLLKLAGGVVLAAWTSLSPFLFTASPALLLPSVPSLFYRFDLFEMWAVTLLVVFVRKRPGSSAGKSVVAALAVWLSAIALRLCIQRLGGGL